MKTNFRIKHIILALLCCISLVASAMSYKVSSQNSLNVRSHPSTSANVVFKLQSDDIVEGVSEIDENGWINTLLIIT